MTQSATGQQCAPIAAPTQAEPGRALRRGTSAGATLALAAVAAVSSAGAAHADEAYTVRQGDTVSHIATRAGVTVQAIARANSLADASRIRVGQQLVIPSSATTSAPTAAAPAPAVAAGATHTVAAGDTVSALAKRHGTTVAAIVSANNLDARALIRIGQTLSIPGSAAPAAASPAASTPTSAPASTGTGTHTVVAGDTVSAIATRYGTTVAAIVSANNLDARALIRIGQTLTVPGQAASAPTTQLVGNTFAGRTYADTVVAAANANKATLLATGVPSKADMQAKVAATAREMGVDPALALAVAFQESGFNHTAVSPANAIGTMQVIPSSGEWAAQLVGRPINLLDPNDNVVAGVAILRSLVKNANDLPTAIAGYYQGASSVKRNGMFADTRRYVANIQTHMERFR
ncbi:LysM peptidoglycan-binding domain-containing protein [Cellulomonas chengniuliangii]|uniref:LysM peptidoglycan-binding domain-containing protein n=1 Tax=Cellulomonas chengniuliangii TaxID=2968084 RepID=UPI001D0ED45C|nr:LysM peptidoglycan-binding domain-containing protein [Cellulomonas chengniuliangii]MCC2317610.1 LysM peptidoglycan-binding domain-containing protein [Cellulomonas chengniuliangii]